MSLQHQKHLFDIPDEITYLNIASLSPSFKSVEQAGIDAVLQKSRPYTIPSSDFFEPVIELKSLFARIIDVDDPNRVATIPAVSYGLANAANNIKLNQGDEILVIEEQFPSNIYVWQKLADRYNAVIKFVNTPESRTDRAEQWNKNILDAITDKTAIVAMGNIHWSNGTLFDLKTISKKAKQHRSLLIIDGSQTIGAFPFSVKEIQPDALVCAGYKWLFGPYGCSYAYYGPYFDNGTPLEDNWANRLHSENFAGLTNYQPEYKPLANRYVVGESGNFIYVKMQIAALKQVLKWNPNDIQEYCKNMSSDVVEELKELGCHVENPSYRTHHLFGIELPDELDLNVLKTALYENKIFVSFRGRFVRVSCHFCNTKKDFETLLTCFKSVLQEV